MNLKPYPNNIQTLIDKIKSVPDHDPELSFEYCRKLLAYAKKSEDTELLGFIYYHIAYIHYSNNEYNLFMQYLIDGIRYQQQARHTTLLARSYNLLAISADNQGNYISALDYYITALNYCKEDDLVYESGMIYTNIGYLYNYLTDYKKAIEYFTIGLDCFNQSNDEKYSKPNIALSQIALGECYYFLGNLEQAIKYADYYIDNFQNDPDIAKHCQIAFSAFYCRILSSTGCFHERETLILKTIPLITGLPSILSCYHEIFDFCEQLLALQRYVDLFTLLDRMDILMEDCRIVNIQINIIKLKITYYKQIDDEANYLSAVSSYFELSQRLEADRMSTTHSAINLRFSLEEIRSQQKKIEQENLIFKARSETDALTGLPNRYLLNKYADSAVEYALNNAQSLAVEFFDCDCFKQYNDTYGHQAGDDCLCAIAGLLKELMCEDIFCARYGGDEFVIIYKNKTDEEVLAIANKLKEDIIALKLENKNSTAAPYMTISQGIRNSVPAEGNKLWDYLFAADAALYQAKRTSRNDICLVHKTSPVNSDFNQISYRQE